MSNFLNKFTEDQYEKTLSEKEKISAPKKIAPKRVIVKDDEDEQPVKSVRRQDFVEETTKDPRYKKQQKVKWIIASLSALVIVVLAVLGYFWMNQVTIPDYLNQPVSDLKTWASRNNMTLDIQEAYSLEVGQDNIISILPEANTKIQKGSIVNVVVSLGSDPEEVLVVPDFSGQSSSDVQAWIDANQAYNLRFSYEYNETIAAGQFIRIKFNNAGTTNETYKRQDYAIAYISNGPEVFEKNIEVPDWTTTHVDVSTAQTWATSKGVKLTVQMVESSVVVNGIVSQSAAAKDLVAKNDTIVVTVSKGVLVSVPDFKSMSLKEATEKIAELNQLTHVDVTLVQMYNDTNGYGTYIWQDIAAGKKIDQTSTKTFEMRVYFSIGKPYIEDMRSRLENTIEKTFYDYNLDAAQLKYTITYVSSCTLNGTAMTAEDKGKICSMSAYNEYVAVGSTINFTIYKP